MLLVASATMPTQLQPCSVTSAQSCNSCDGTMDTMQLSKTTPERQYNVSDRTTANSKSCRLQRAEAEDQRQDPAGKQLLCWTVQTSPFPLTSAYFP